LNLEGEQVHENRVSGTLVWYYHICRRQVWLIAHQLTPDAEDPNLFLGRLIDQTSYAREKKELVVGSSKMDVYRFADGHLLVGEVKKSSRSRKSARMQLAFYLKELAAHGVQAQGELRFPAERARETVVLDAPTVAEVEETEREILRIIYQEKPPPPEKCRYCRRCAYAEFCWA
jgi:CRISPR-associated exonuclease Cas4